MPIRIEGRTMVAVRRRKAAECWGDERQRIEKDRRGKKRIRKGGKEKREPKEESAGEEASSSSVKDAGALGTLHESQFKLGEWMEWRSSDVELGTAPVPPLVCSDLVVQEFMSHFEA